MARGRYLPSEEKVKTDMTPIIDVVFNLLIFFMLTMNFQDEEGVLKASLPKDSGLNPHVVIPDDTEEIRVRILKETQTTQIYVGSNRIQDERALVSTLERLNSLMPENYVLIDSGKEAEFRYVIQVLNACKAVGMKEIRFKESKPS